MIMTSVDWKRVGLAAGSKTDDTRLERLEKSTDISTERKIVAEEDLMRPSEMKHQLQCDLLTRFDIAVLNKTRRVSS